MTGRECPLTRSNVCRHAAQSGISFDEAWDQLAVTSGLHEAMIEMGLHPSQCEVQMDGEVQASDGLPAKLPGSFEDFNQHTVQL